MKNRRIVITGMGAVSPLGNDVEQLWQNLLKGESGVADISLFDAKTFPTQFAAEVRNLKFLENVPDEFVEQQQIAGRNSGFMIAAGLQAWTCAGLPLPSSEGLYESLQPDRIGIYLGAGEGPVDFDNFIAPTVAAWQAEKKEMDWEQWGEIALQCLDPIREMEQEANMPGAHLAQLFKLRGPCMSCLTACAASTQAIGEALNLIRYGEADMMIAGGTHSMIHPLGVTGFNRLTALSTRNDSCITASRPFDQDRDGFVLAEGAGAIILEELETAQARGVTILGEIIGYGSTADAFRVTDQHEDGRGGIAAVNLAIKDAGLQPQDIDYISAHGTGTAENDSIETRVIKSVFGDYAYNVPISSVKSMLGHLIAAAGVVEFITCVLAIRDQIIPPTTNLTSPDRDLDLDYVPNEPRKHPVKVAMSNSFGFGGQNNTIIVKKFEA
jgi:3-oxoacyl-[acyl-carrier-protein] synthase II